MRCVAFLLAALCASSAFAQIFYEPVHYQYSTGNGDEKFCYGGSDPRVLYYANNDCPAYHYGGINFHRFDGGTSFNQPSPMYQRDRVFSDCVRGLDASYFGYTCADARNEAVANAPLYFRKADLINSAIREPDGSLTVHSSGPIYVARVHAAPARSPRDMSTRPTTRPTSGQVIIIPKKLLDRPVKDFEKHPQPVASAG
jgi:hypothetical protein